MQITRRWGAALVVAACAAGLAVASTADANAGTSNVSPLATAGYTQLVNAHSKLCMGVSGSKAGGRVVVLEGCTGNPDREWAGRKLDASSGAWFNVANKYSGLCLGVAGNANQAAASLAQYRCADVPNQHWVSVKTSSGWTVVNQMSAMCMSVDAAHTAPGTRVTQYPCGNFVDQTWLSR
jgi:hypothetical protein